MTPVDEDRALDEEDGGRYGASDQRGREAMDPATRRLAIIAGGIGLLLAILVGGWAFGGRHAGSIPVIEAAAGPVRLKPVDAGGMQALGAQAPPPVNGNGREALAPGPEAPRPEALQAEVDAARRAADQGSGDAVAAPPKVSRQSPAATTPPPILPGAPDKASEQPAPARDLRTDVLPAPAAGSASTGGASGGIAIQLAAVDSHDAAQAEWKRLSGRHPGLFTPEIDGGKTPEVLRADRDGHAIYRLRMRGFGSQAAALSFCRQARAQDVACTVADF
ncbi:SPOR domain-containing protein [Lichenicoccus roseus]|uniref:SPOR domain-containing protein n=1 Tax=Lichenicoccus roseus TaxID=2683649 RepID=A0A5R9JAR9_9PROT|nr:SPOR domain-containing protein [Lichenicoccus roseus]TLU72466.1 SPOR domain-containing protein [Lichenicoccus roseus]